MADQYTYACRDYPGMENCPFQVCTQSKDELWQQMALHARVAHNEDPQQWSSEDRKYLEGLIKDSLAD